MKKILIFAITSALTITLFVGVQNAFATTTYVDSVESFSQGLKKDGSLITDPARTDPAKALGPADGVFFSLGYGGTLTLKFPLTVGGTLTITTLETTWGGYPEEDANVYVSTDGVNFDFIGVANNLTNQPSTDPHPTVFNLGDKCVRYVKLVDVTNSAIHNNDSDGFDVDTVKADFTQECYPTEPQPLTCPSGTTQAYVETVTVPSDGTTVLSANILKSGVKYILEASGTYIYWPAQLPSAGIADAKYSLRPEGSYNLGPGPRWISGDSLPSPWTNYLEVLVDSGPVSWGAFNLAHEYYLLLDGTDSAAGFRILDSYYGDNSGSLQVDIYKCVCPGDIRVINRNNAVVNNNVTVIASTGYNFSAGGSGGAGGDGGVHGKINKGNDDNDGGNGGSGSGNGASINTGNAYAKAKTFNLVNTNITRVRR